MTDARDPFHAHICYDASDRSAAAQLHATCEQRTEHDLVNVLFVGEMTDRPVGSHPIPQYEAHFYRKALQTGARANQGESFQGAGPPAD